MGYTMPGPIPYRVMCIPPNNQMALREPTSIAGCVNHFTYKKEIDRIFMPCVGFKSARRAHFREFTDRLPVRDGLEVLASKNPSDLAALRPRQGLLFRAAGSLLVMATGEGYCIGGNVEMETLLSSESGEREHETVMHAIATSFDRKGIARENIVLRGFFGIPWQANPYDPRHPTEGGRHAETLEKLEGIQARAQKRKGWQPKDAIIQHLHEVPHVSLYHVLKAQALLLDITRVGCEQPLPVNGNYPYPSHADPAMKKAQNWILAWRAA